MNFIKLQEFVAHTWNAEALPTLMKYVAIPCESPAFGPSWA